MMSSFKATEPGSAALWHYRRCFAIAGEWTLRMRHNLLARPPVAWLSVALLLGVSSVALAQGAGRRVIRLEAIKVEGRIQKPQAFYILQRSNLNFESLDLKRSFVPKILESVEKEPF
jgi:hypothetical protein